MEESIKQSIIDDEHLKLLSIFHYISGGIDRYLDKKNRLDS